MLSKQITYQVLADYHRVQELRQSLRNGPKGRYSNSIMQFCKSREIMVITSWGQKARFLCIDCLQSQRWTQNVMWTH